MFWSRKYGARRTEVRKNRPDLGGSLYTELKARGVIGSLGVAVVFALAASAIVMLRDSAVPYKPGQYVPQDVLSRVDFNFTDQERLTKVKQEKRESQPHVFKANGDAWGDLQAALSELPERVGDKDVSQLPASLATALQVAPGSDGILNILRQYKLPTEKSKYLKAVEDFIKDLRPLVVLPAAQRETELSRGNQRFVMIQVADHPAMKPDETLAEGANKELRDQLNAVAGKHFYFAPALAPKLVVFSLQTLKPTHVLDENATLEAQNLAAQGVPASEATVKYIRNQPLVLGNRVLSEMNWQVLRAEKEQFIRQLGRQALKSKMGLAGLVMLITAVLSVYIYRYHGRIVRNNVRGIAIGALLISMLLLAQLAAIGTGPLYIFGLAPTILVAMTMTMAYDQRFAIGIASMHGLLVTLALDQGVGFYIILWVGVFTCCLMLDEIRTRSKLIEVGGATALAMMVATAAAGAVSLDPVPFIAKYCLYSGAAGLAVGFVVLGILPFVEKSFRITTSMTLLELADASQPLLRRLAIEAPGTYNHSLQVATLAESAAEAIGANSLLCRVAAYYHDVGKINKADYFIENQADGRNRHINLSPSVSLLIIIGHVKDGIELAKEYNLPASILPFIQQHHGTTLIEYFYHQACTRQGKDNAEGPSVSETQYRYAGPKPKSKEIAILMICDAVESAVRAMPEPNASRIEALVHELAMKRLHDGQFDECDLTFRELELIERSLTKTLLGIYHGRIAYPSSSTTSGGNQAGPQYPQPTTAARTA
ncbi:MAG: putative rane protein [Phycisphaerales bacterium]|nr:putative rane protein [Phycisphaerales bacterium]